MASARRTNHSRQRRQRAASVSSGGSNAPVWTDEDADDDDDNAAHNRQPKPLTTPRTKRRSITHLHELVQRQKEERQQQRTHTVAAVTPLEIERKIESLLVPRASPDRPRERRLIQVAVRCRPRTCRRFQARRALLDADREFEEEDSEDEAFSGGERTSDDARRARLPPDSVVQYDLPSPPPTTSTQTAATSRARPLQAISVPSHVLALGGHGPRRRFEFDSVFPPWKQQLDVYDAAAYDVIEDVLVAATRTPNAGRDDDTAAAAHATIVAYGQTGTGKTYTMGMLQRADAAADEREHGIIPRALLHILSRVHEANQRHANSGDATRLVVRMSFLQIYLEAIQDLLVAPGRAPAVSREGRGRVPQAAGVGGLPVRLDPASNEFYVAGLSEFPVRDVADARALLELAAQNRVLAATARNKTSSRSHTLLTISIKRKRFVGARDSDQDEEEDGDGDVDGDALSPPSTVSFVDLAGSERVDGALHFLHATRKRQELRIREAKFINRSLSALGSVIAALSAQDERRGESASSFPRHPTTKPGVPSRAAPITPHIRFRDSQLTKLLQARLMNGQGRLVLIATIDDRPANLTETLSTLKFASQCRRVDLSRRRAATADAARQQREEALRKQVFAEVKVMYEEREATLRRQYDARIAVLEDELAIARRETKSRVSGKTPPHPNAAYVALCSLVDIAQRQLGRPAVPHPTLDTFEQESAMVAYVADLYRQLKDGISRPEEESTRNASETRRRSSSLRRRRSSRVAGQDSNHSEAEAAPTVASQVASVGDADVTADKEADFQALARFLFTSGMLQSIPVSSSDEDGDAPYSQLDE